MADEDNKNCSAHKVKIKNLEDYQKVQNGRLGRIEKRIDKIFYLAVALLGTVIGNLVVYLI